MKKLLILLFITTVLFSCSDQEIVKIEDQSDSKTNFAQSMRTFAGDSLILENPYSLENMRLALNTIKNKDKSSSYLSAENFQINASHLYIKFKPRNEEEEGLLKADSTMYLFDYRLDVEYKSSFLENRPVTGDSIPEYYTAIPIDKALPNVPYETLEQLYIPEQDTYFANTQEIEKYLINDKINNKTDLFNHLIFNAFVQTNNEDEVLEPGSTATQRWFFGKRWRPKGTITIHDDRLKQIPLEGAKILMRQWFTVDSGITGANGYFQTGTVRGHARYIIQWERADWSIRSGWFGQAELRGPNLKNEDWNHYIDNANGAGNAQQYYGTIHRAAHYYFYKNIDGLRRPPHRAFFRGQIKFAAYLVSSGTSYNAVHTTSFQSINPLLNQPWPTITIKRYNLNSSVILGTTFHELAHSTHARHRGLLRFTQSETRMRETYAKTIEWYLTTKMYRDIRPDLNIIYRSNFQYDYPAFDPDFTVYTSLMVDLIDNFNQRTEYGNIYVLDNVSGFTINQVENEVMQTRKFSELKTNLIDNYDNPTEGNLNELFNNW